MRLVCQRKLSLGLKSIFSVTFSCLQRGLANTLPPSTHPSKGGILALTSLNCDASEDESLTLITSGNTQSTVCTLDVAADN